MNNDIQLMNNTEMIFSGRWDHRRLLPRRYGIFNNSSSVSMEAGAWAECTFSGCNRLEWYTSLNDPGMMGSAEVYIDGKYIRTVDLSAFPEKQTTLAFDSGELEQGEHTLRLVTCSDEKHSIEIDKIIAYGTPGKYRTIHNRNMAFAHYTFGFEDRGSLVCSREVGDEAELYFLGSTVRFYGETGPECGKLELFIDHESRGVIDCYREASQLDTLLFSCEDLTGDSFHVLTLRVLGQANALALDRRIGVDHFVVENRPCVLTVMNARTDAEVNAMKDGKATYTDPSQWHPVTLPGKVPMNNVELHKGVFLTAFERNITYLKDCLKKPLWIDSKDPHRIWVDILVASNEGRMLLGMGNTLRYREVPEFRTAVREIIDTVERRQYGSDNGYLMPYDSCNYKLWDHMPWPWTSKGEQKNYDRAMFTKGMLAAGSAGFTDVYPIMRKFYDWFNSAEQYLPHMLLDSMAIQGSIAGPLMYHSPAGVPQDIITNMKYYDLDWWMEYLDAGIPEAVYRFTLNRPHNYLLTSICAYFEQYTATGMEKYLKACRGAWKIYHEYFQNIGGGISVCEHFECAPKSQLISNLPNCIYETCGNVFWIDLNHRLHQLEPDNELYASHIEQSLYSIVFACQGEDGRIRYFNQMDARKFPLGRFNTCCEIQATMLFGQLPQYIYMLTEDGAYLNQFAASSIEFTVEDRPYRLTCSTRFPYEDAVALTVSAPEGGKMNLRVRVPSWLTAETEILLNGTCAAVGKPGSYVSLNREWTDGDTVSFRLPMQMKASRYVGQNRVKGFSRYAFEYGPILMALQGPLNESCTPGESAAQSADMTPTPRELVADGEELTIRLAMSCEDFLSRLKLQKDLVFSVEGEPSYSLVPYWSIMDQTYSCFPVFNKSEEE